MKNSYSVVIIGGGAAGFFAAIKCAEMLPRGSVLLLEQTQKILSKVKISGGGRCNVTHSCFEPKKLIQNYPRGSKELLGPFFRFQPKDLVEWFNQRNVQLKTEEDGRMFPVTDDSQTIIDCLNKEASKWGVQIELGAKVTNLKKNESTFSLELKTGQSLIANKVMLATGGGGSGIQIAQNLGHNIVSLVPSLFTFNVPDSPLLSLSGISFEDVVVSLPEIKMEYRGPILLTHWGFSGPAVLKLSAWAARELYDRSYFMKLCIDWFPSLTFEEVQTVIEQHILKNLGKVVENDSPFLMPKNLWINFIKTLDFKPGCRWAEVSKAQKLVLIQKLKKDYYQISGKTTYKQEFVTAGGVDLSEIDFKRMESKLVPNLFFGGEILNIDGITGGFNFQAAWTAGWIAGESMGR